MTENSDNQQQNLLQQSNSLGQSSTLTSNSSVKSYSRSTTPVSDRSTDKNSRMVGMDVSPGNKNWDRHLNRKFSSSEDGGTPEVEEQNTNFKLQSPHRRQSEKHSRRSTNSIDDNSFRQHSKTSPTPPITTPTTPIITTTSLGTLTTPESNRSRERRKSSRNSERTKRDRSSSRSQSVDR